VLSYALGYLNHNSEDRRDVALELEAEIIKCIKAIVNTKVGGKEVMDHPEYIHAVVFSIVCPQWQTRKMVCELLAFLCYLEGYEHVVRGFELLKKYKKTLGLYDAWIRVFLRTIVHDKYLRNEMLPESHLMEYAVSDAFNHSVDKLTLTMTTLLAVQYDLDQCIDKHPLWCV